MDHFAPSLYQYEYIIPSLRSDKLIASAGASQKASNFSLIRDSRCVLRDNTVMTEIHSLNASDFGHKYPTQLRS